MSNKELSREERKLKVIDGLRRNHQAYVMFYWLLGVFTIVTGIIIWVMIYAMFHPETRPDTAPFTTFIGVDGVIGWSIRHIVKYLNPLPGAATKQLPPAD